MSGEAHLKVETDGAVGHEIAVHVSPLSAAMSKRLLWEALDRTPAEVERLETALHRHVMGRPDAGVGVTAFLEHRTPEWTSRVSTDWPDWPDWPDERRGRGPNRTP